MEINKLISYKDVVDSLNKKNRTKHLLFGNGFSMAYNAEIFSYNALSNFIENLNDPLLSQLFNGLNTKNFELIMQQLDNFCEIASIFKADKHLINSIKQASEKLKNSLLDAVKELHPEHVFKMSEEKCKHCFSFLESYLSNNGFVFSTNYDLLPYWVLMRNNSKFAIDGFGRDLENDIDEFIAEEDLEFSELRWGKYKERQTIFYMHGTLPFFDTGIHIVKEEYDGEHVLIEKIKKRIAKKEYPIFVTAGNVKEKLAHIMHNRYLSFCYEKLCSIKGSLVTFGFNFGEYDTHIIDAINKAAHDGKRGGDKNKLVSVYIGVYSDEALAHINMMSSKFKCKVVPYNARTVNIWGY
jgi:hypothetical protein